jgi:hypothetical protein
VVGQFAFGDLTRAECLRSIALFAEEVMPQLRGKNPVSEKGSSFAEQRT